MVHIYKKIKYFYGIDFYEKYGNNGSEIDVIYDKIKDGWDEDNYYFFTGDKKTYFCLFKIYESIARISYYEVKRICYVKTYLLIIKKLIEVCPFIKKIRMCGDESVKIRGIEYNLHHHYFFRYGIGFYEKHFGFKLALYNGNDDDLKNEWSNNKIRKKKLVITKKLIEYIFYFYSGVFEKSKLSPNETKKLEYFLSRFDKNISIFCGKINPKKSHRFYFFLLDRISKIYCFENFYEEYELDINDETLKDIDSRLEKIGDIIVDKI